MMTSVKFALGIIALMLISYAVGYCMGEYDADTKWQIERANQWKPLKG